MKFLHIIIGWLFLAGLFSFRLYAVDPVAPLNGSKEFDADTGSYNLKVDTEINQPKPRTIKADKFEILEGPLDIQYTIDPSVGSGKDKRVATVQKPSGSVFYRVSGTYVETGSGTGTGKNLWTADYDRGGKRMIAWVNTASRYDDFVGLGGGAAVTVFLPFPYDDKNYTIRLSNGPGPGKIKFYTSPGWADSFEFRPGAGLGRWLPTEILIKGDTAGMQTIHVENISVSPSGDVLTPVDVNCPIVAVAVNSVAIKKANDSALPVYSDDKGEDVGLNPEWDDQGRNEAAAFARAENKKIKFRVTFSGMAGTTVKVKAVIGDTVYVKDDTTVVFPSGDGMKRKEVDVEIQQPIGNAVDLKQWNLKWQYEGSDGKWIDTTQTQHRIYVTFAKPSAMPIQLIPNGADQLKTLDSFYYNACKGAIGKNDVDNDVKGAIWTYFKNSALHSSNVIITRADGLELGYWRGFTPPQHCPFRTLDLISGTTGDCSAWGHFYAAVLAIHGLTCKVVQEQARPYLDKNDPARPNGFTRWDDLLFKNWTFNGPGLAAKYAPFSWLFKTTCGVGGDYLPQETFPVYDCNYAGGLLSAHGNLNPPAEWDWHMLIKDDDGQYYDICYGAGPFPRVNGVGGYGPGRIDGIGQRYFVFHPNGSKDLCIAAPFANAPAVDQTLTEALAWPK
ncbi:MAG: hypothetical protein HZA50_16655 [Planctomycetes bacterium]|nr:hypothetical protein [Planctomycetota bacterium]